MANWSNSSGFGGAWGNTGGARARSNNNTGSSLGSMGGNDWTNAASRWVSNAPSVPNLMNYLSSDTERLRNDWQQSAGVQPTPSRTGRSWEESANEWQWLQQQANPPRDFVGEFRDYFGAIDRGHQASALASQLSAPTLNALYAEDAMNRALSGLNSQSRALDARALRGDYSSDMARLGIKSSDLDLDRANNALRLEGLGIDRRENESDREFIGRLRDIASRQFTSDSNRISFEGQDQARQIKSQYLTNGALFAPGHRYEQGANYLRTLNDLEGRRLANEEQMAGFDNREQGTRFKEERIGLSERELGIANQRLDLMAQNLGIDRDTLARNLQIGLERLGLAGQVDAFQLLAQTAGTNEQVGQAKMESVNRAIQLLSQAAALGMQPGDLYQSAFGGRLPVFPGS